MMNRLLTVLGLLALVCLTACSPDNQKFENKSLLRAYESKGNTYMFRFGFVNTESAPIQIVSVAVFDDKNQKLENGFDADAEDDGKPVEMLTHDLKLTGYLKSVMGSGLKELYEENPMFEGTPLEMATLKLNGLTMEAVVEERTLSAGEAIRPSRYLFASKQKYDALTLKVTYRLGKEIHEAAQVFKVTEEQDVKNLKHQGRHAKNDQTAMAEQKPAQGDTTQPQTNADGQTGFLVTLDRWLEPLAYRAVSFSKRSDGLWLSEGGNEKHIIKATSPSDLDVYEITDGGQVLYSLGGKSYLLPRADGSPRQINLELYGAALALSHDGHWAVVSDREKGSHLVDMNDGTLLPLPKQPLPDRSKVFLEKGMDAEVMESMRQQLADPENNRIRDSDFVWSTDNDRLAFLRCAGVCAIVI